MTENKPPKKKKRTKTKYIDDGHTIYSMEGLDPDAERKKKAGDIRLTRKERWAAIRAGLGRYLPILFMVLACFALAGGIVYLWLMH